MQDELGVAVRLRAALEDQVAGRLEGRTVEVRAPSADSAGRRHSAGRPPPPCAAASAITCALVDDAVLQPVGDVLAGDAQASRGLPSGRHRGCRAPWSSRRPGRSSAPHSRGCPARCCRAPAARRPATSSRRSASGMVSRSSQGCARRLAGQLRLPCRHIDLVVVQRVQRRGGGRGHPGGVGAGLGMADLLLQHVGHAVGRGPHALADLRLARQAAGEADIDVAVLVGLDPGAWSSSRPCAPSARPPSRCGSRRRCGRGSRC